MASPSGGLVFDDKNPFNVHFSEHVETARHGLDSTDVDMKPESPFSELVFAGADLVPMGHSINPITGKTSTSSVFFPTMKASI